IRMCGCDAVGEEPGGACGGDIGDIDVVLDPDSHPRQRTAGGGTVEAIGPCDDTAQCRVEDAGGRAAAGNGGGPTRAAAQDALPARSAAVASSSTIHDSVSTTTP